MERLLPWDVAHNILQKLKRINSSAPDHTFLRLVSDAIQAERDHSERLAEALEFYGDEKKYFYREDVLNLQETTAVLKVPNPMGLPTDLKVQTAECSAKIKADGGRRAREALALYRKEAT
jgi:hypothetical protein